MRALHKRGYGDRGATAPVANLRFPTEFVAGELAAGKEPFEAVKVEDRSAFSASRPATPRAVSRASGRFSRSGTAARWTAWRRPSWTRARARWAASPWAVRQSAHRGSARDRRIPAIRALMLEYCRGGGSKPLSIAVFGAPDPASPSA